MGNILIKEYVKRWLGPYLLNTRFIFSAPLAYAPGHFYSPVCDPKEVKRRYKDPSLNPPPAEIVSVDLGYENQITLWKSWHPFLKEARAFIVNNETKRYHIPSTNYDIGDAIIYVCMLRYLQPKRLIEVGSGSSSALALDTFDRYFNPPPRCTFIEPHPTLLQSLLMIEDKKGVEIIPTCVQDVPPEFFDDLCENDLLFIDSTHIVKTGSDVAYELFEILPRLRTGVVVHFHDVFYPFEYPANWVLEKNCSWNELYTLRAYLMGNRDWEILFFNDYFARIEHTRVQREAPEILSNPGGGLWLRRR